MTRFVHLHTHSHYSLLQALPKIKELVGAAKTMCMDALALTDNGNLYGAIEFYKAARAAGIKPIIGLDAYVAARTRFDREPGIDNRRARLVLLAKNEVGYKNLIKLVTHSHLEGFYYKPRIDRELIEKHREGLIALLPSFSGEHALALKHHDEEKAGEAIARYRAWFRDDLYLEVTRHPEIEGHEELQKNIIALSKKHGVPLVAAHDTYYLRPEDRPARETMVRIQSGADYSERGGWNDSEEDFSFINQEQALAAFADIPEAVENTTKIAAACNLEIPMKWMFPKYVIESGRSPDDELECLARAGIVWRGLPDSGEVRGRLTYELEIIKGKGYATYFLVVGDLLREARARGILTTIRGSVAGSLTTYVLGITNVNPLEYKIPFERFLNPERPSAPDIDMDFADDRRDEMIQYAKDKYGEDHVAQIGTFGTMMARGSVRDVARALGHPYGLGDRIAKLIPFGSQGFPMSIDRALEITPELAALYKKEREVKDIIDLAKKIENCARHISVHAAGVVIAPEPLINYVPLQFDPKSTEGHGKLITQYDMRSVGEDGIGLLKFDFLGIKNLSILANSVRRVKKLRNIDIDIENVPLDDKKTFDMLSRGETHGLFQLNGSGMTRFLKELKPSTIHDINAMVALYRPGPMESIPSYIERKHNPHLVHYLDPRLKDILSQSYGVITYQDDVLLIAVQLAGYSWLDADKLRKAMGKKIPEEMEAQKEKLQEGFRKNGMNAENARRLWLLIEPFAAYGFNKAHAASYGKVAYQTAYMKANFPVEYMAAVLTADSGDVEKIAETIHECGRMGIEVLPPSINESYGDFAVVKDTERPTIRFGLHSIKNFGEGIADAIIAERKATGRYTSIANFLSRIHDRNLNKKSLEALVKGGALDDFADRAILLHNLDRLLTFNRESKQNGGNQDSLFVGTGAANDMELSLEQVEPASQTQKLAWEKELLGLYVSGHPLDQYKEKLTRQKLDITRLKQEVHEGITTVVAGIVEDIRPILTKGGERMAFARIADYGGSIEVVVFPRVFTEYQQFLAPENCIAVKGRLSGRNGEKSIIVEAVKAL